MSIFMETMSAKHNESMRNLGRLLEIGESIQIKLIRKVINHSGTKYICTEFASLGERYFDNFFIFTQWKANRLYVIKP